MGAEAPLAPRFLLARYRMGPLLGRGGMAEVYDGYDERLHRLVAVKVLRPEVAADPGVRTRFEIEARSAAGLSHPNVVAVFDTGEDEGTPFIVMERLPGETLADRMAAGPVDQAWLRKVAGDVLGALGAAHAAGLVHRDVKPGNILLAEDGCAKVADFGIAKSLEVTSDLTGTGLLFGTPAYLAPERLEGHPATERSDLYALGVVLYEALAGVKPFDGLTAVAVADAVLHAAPIPLAQARPDVDPAFASAVEQSMSRDPSDRPGSAREMARALVGTAATLAQDPTVALPGDLPGPDATLVGAPGLISSPAGEAVRPLAGDEGSAPVGPVSPDGRMSPAMRVALLAAGALVVVLVALALAGGGSGGGSGQTALVADIHELADRVRSGDGPLGSQASERLDTIGDHVEAGGGADEANALLADAARWTQQGQLSATATQAMATLLAGIDGVDPSLATVTTVAPTTVPPPVEDDGDGDGDGDGDRGRGKRGGKDDG